MGKLIFRKKFKIWLPFKTKFSLRRKIGLEYLIVENGNMKEKLVTFLTTNKSTNGNAIIIFMELRHIHCITVTELAYINILRPH